LIFRRLSFILPKVVRHPRRTVEKRQEQAVKTKKSPSKEDFTQALHKAGYRLTSQREAIFGYLASLKGTHPSPRQVHEELKESDASISLATVYNTMGALVRLGLVKIIEFESLENRYDLDVEPHINLLCTACGGIQDLYVGSRIHVRCAMEERGFSVEDFRLEYYGRCASCAGVDGRPAGSPLSA
jgi:Fe2+ or Zn2+ uptake regulation protein